MSWVIFRPDETDIETFVEEKAPSKILKNDGYAWIYVRSQTNGLNERDENGDEDEDEDEDDANQDIDEMFYDKSKLKRDWDALCKSVRSSVNYQAVCELAIANRCRSGKWLIYESAAKVDKVWADIARATVKGNLGCSAKVSAHDDSITNHVICVYNEDFTDRDSVLNLEKGLRRLEIGMHLSYKPDVYTYLGIYAKNKWNVKPTLCSSKYDFEKNQWNVQFTKDEAAEAKSQTKLTQFMNRVPRSSTSHQSDVSHPSSQKQEPPSKRIASHEETDEPTKTKVQKV